MLASVEKPALLSECPPGVNPRYWLYARSLGHTLEEQKVADEVAWPGGSMTGWVLWMSEKWRGFCKVHEVRNSAEAGLKLGDRVHGLFDNWLADDVGREAGAT